LHVLHAANPEITSHILTTQHLVSLPVLHQCMIQCLAIMPLDPVATSQMLLDTMDALITKSRKPCSACKSLATPNQQQCLLLVDLAAITTHT